MKQKLVILYHYTRCGSTALSDAISRCDEFVCYGEIYNPDNAFFYTDVKPNKILFNDIKNSVELHYQCSQCVPLIEITYYDLYSLNSQNFFSELLPNLADYFDVSILHLRRINVLQRIISSDLAAQTKIYHNKSDAEFNIDKVFFEYNITDLVERSVFEMNLICRDQLSLLGFNVFDCSYERNVLNKELFFLSNFLNLGRPLEFKSTYRKLNPLSERITNFYELLNDLKIHNLDLFLSR
jgi:hypothetical protein